MLTKTTIKNLATIQGAPCVSIYIPTHKAGAEVQQNPIRLKNKLSEIETQLYAMGLTKPEVQDLLEPAYTLIPDTLFWQYQSKGLVLFVSSEHFHLYRLPFHFESLAVVADRFHLKPLFPLLSGDGRFYILTLSQDRVRLLQGTRYSISEIEPEHIPEGLSQTQEKDWERRVQFHSGTRGPGRGLRPAIFHGHGAGKDGKMADEILQYFREVDAGLQDLLHNEHVPLLLVGVDSLHSLYRKANTYPYLLETGLMKHPESLDDVTLHTETWAIVQPQFQALKQQALTRYRQLAGMDEGPVANTLQEIVPAARYGRVETLFVAQGRYAWGTCPDGNQIEIHTEAVPGDEDLLDFASVHTLLNDGTVYALPPDEMPDTTALAAMLRF